MSTLDLIAKQKLQTFHLGLTMAGAVSAGAYTGGVMDYMMQAMEQWQQAKDRNNAIWERLEQENSLTEEALKDHNYDFRIPMHNVVIDAIGGASAGGMTSTMCMMAAVDKDYTPVETLEQTLTHEGTKNNIFYESWVRLQETDEEKAMDLLLQHTDLAGKGIQSILNVDIIDKLAQEAFKNIDKLCSANLRPYFSPNVELLHTLTSLRGIQLSVDFTANEALQSVALNAKLRHNMYTHTVVAQFIIDHEARGTEKYNYLDMRSNLLKESSIATGAFPFGLKARRINGMSYYYIHAAIRRTLGDVVNLNDFNENEDFEFIAVDGGTMNNEPYAEVYNVVEKSAAKTRASEDGKECICHGIVMIDPFPNYNDVEKYDFKDKVTELPLELYNSLRQQSMVKDSSVFNKQYSRWMIAPFKWTRGGSQYQYPLCCASLGAFGGFFDEEFRKHDFFLGRNNCKNFLRRFFTIKWTEGSANNEPIHKYWTPEMRAIFQTKTKQEQYLQIIPDLCLLDTTVKHNPRAYTYQNFPKYNTDKLIALKPKLEQRIVRLLKEVQLLGKSKDKPAPTDEEAQRNMAVAEILKGMFPKSWYSKLIPSIKLKGIPSLVFFLGTGIVARRLSKMVVETIVKDFHTQGLLEGSEEKLIDKAANK